MKKILFIIAILVLVLSLLIVIKVNNHVKEEQKYIPETYIEKKQKKLEYFQSSYEYTIYEYNKEIKQDVLLETGYNKITKEVIANINELLTIVKEKYTSNEILNWIDSIALELDNENLYYINNANDNELNFKIYIYNPREKKIHYLKITE